MDEKRSGRHGLASSASGLTIGELAARTGVTPEAIRFYEREGVIPAAARGGAGRYRMYGSDDAKRLRFVRRARDLGFSLEEVSDLLALASSDPKRPCADVNVLANRQLARVQAKLAQLSALRVQLHRLLDACARDTSIGDCSILEALSGPDSGESVE